MTTINIKIDEEIKRKAKNIAFEMGIPLGTVLKMYLKQFVRTKKLEINLEEEMGKNEWITESEEALKSGKRYSDVDELFEDCMK